jgi:formamidopyrimidine-DNA glycosylase
VPELPEVEAVCRKLRRDAVGAPIERVIVYRARSTHPQHPSELERAAGQRIKSVERRGKNILIHLSGGFVLRVHLRMTGNLFVVPDARLHSERVRVSFALQDGRGLVFEDTRALGVINLHRTEDLDRVLSNIGIDPLTRAFTPEWLVQAASASKQPAKLFLMDQSIIAGVGNIYAAEALFRARIDPRKPMSGIRRPKLEALHAAVVDILRQGIKAAVIAYSKPGDYSDTRFIVYDRKDEPCDTCGRKIRRIVQGGRSTYFCPGCQR